MRGQRSFGVLLLLAGTLLGGCIAAALVIPAGYAVKEYAATEERALICACTREVAVQYAVRAARSVGFAPGAVPTNAASFDAEKFGGMGDKLTVDFAAGGSGETRITVSIRALLGRSKSEADKFVAAIMRLGKEAITGVPKP